MARQNKITAYCSRELGHQIMDTTDTPLETAEICCSLCGAGFSVCGAGFSSFSHKIALFPLR
jgi:hypothetical protein